MGEVGNGACTLRLPFDHDLGDLLYRIAGITARG